MRKISTIIDDFYNDDIIVNYEKERTRKEKVDFYSTKKHIRPPSHVKENIGFRFKKAFGGNRINYTEELSINNEIENNLVRAIKHNENVSIPLHGLPQNSSTDQGNLSPYTKEKIGLYKNLLENASINDTMKNDPVEPVVFIPSINAIQEDKEVKSVGFFGSIKNLFSLKK